MRTLYKVFYQEKKRGFTDQEFRQVCEQTAATSLEELFNYASATGEIDYQKYFGYAGLQVDLSPLPQPTDKASNGIVKRSFQLKQISSATAGQQAILKGIMK